MVVSYSRVIWRVAFRNAVLMSIWIISMSGVAIKHRAARTVSDRETGAKVSSKSTSYRWLDPIAVSLIPLKRVGTSPGFVSSSPFVVNKIVIGWDLSPRNKFPLLVFFNEFANQIFTWFSVLMQIQNFHFWFCPPLWPQKFWFPPLSRLPRPLYIAGNVDPPRVISKRNECTEGSCRRFERQFNEKEKKIVSVYMVPAWFRPGFG